ncbi:CHAD domain-containing [Chlorella sorokiniana]|uniref:CHAD domain-containing n=1 Tax=Chlorella sorokiniana TaxID=3076 RepID=A0A2P6TXR8_CHLSO|nr:CHAD domain-containing [Chlorella sorokiniana]|eukprot:PRW58862.1 CHAD domain-containing [Chlorella sorokiniana]
MRVVVSADLPLDAQAYLLERDGAAFRTFMCEEMSLLEYDITRCWREGQATKIRLNSKPDVGAWIPGALAQKVPDKLEYFDEITYHPDLLPAAGPFELHIHSKAPFLGDKGKFESRVVIEALGPGRCRHTLEQTIEFKGLWGLGSVAKKLAKKSLEDSFADMPGIMAKWANIRQDLLQTPHGRERLLAGRPKIEGVSWIDEHVTSIKQGAHPHRGRGKPHRHEGGEQAVAHVQQAQQAQPSSGAPRTAKRGRVHGVRVAADGQPLPAVVEGISAAGSRPPSSASYSADRSSSDDVEEDWTTSAPWRAYYQAHGLEPMRRVHTLPPQLVKRMFSGRRPRPVEVEPLGGSSQVAAPGGPAASRGMLRRLKAALARWFGRGRAH